MEAQEGNSSDMRPETEAGSANASNTFTPDFIENFNDVPSNQCDFDHSIIDPSAHPSKEARCKKYPVNMDKVQQKLALQARFKVDGNRLMMEGPSGRKWYTSIAPIVE
ncbi:hypothetical protein Ancab_014480 [Ancistrocladus abbreviatus]